MNTQPATNPNTAVGNNFIITRGILGDESACCYRLSSLVGLISMVSAAGPGPHQVKSFWSVRLESNSRSY